MVEGLLPRLVKVSDDNTRTLSKRANINYRRVSSIISDKLNKLDCNFLIQTIIDIYGGPSYSVPYVGKVGIDRWVLTTEDFDTIICIEYWGSSHPRSFYIYCNEPNSTALYFIDWLLSVPEHSIASYKN